MRPLARRILIFEAVYAAIAAALVLAVYIGVPSQGEGNLAAWAVAFLSEPVVLLLGRAGVTIETIWSTLAGRSTLFGFYAIVAAALPVILGGIQLLLRPANLKTRGPRA